MAATKTLIAALLAVAAPLASAAGNARVINNCADSVAVFSVGQAISDPVVLAAGGGLYTEAMIRDPVTVGRSISVTRNATDLYLGHAQTVFAYTLADNDLVYYDLTDVNGDAFSGSHLTLASADASCPTTDWPAGAAPDGVETMVCEADSDITLTLCAA